ncbi:MAG TPA: cytochrome c [Candidatus Acidoferrales bacterium]|nr:cytochrome c [Candidatus Acidoferrales bacterium]
MFLRFLKCSVAFAVFTAALLLSAGPAGAQGSGEKTYKAKCVMCHGADGKGETAAGKATKVRDFCSEDVQKESDDEWIATTTKGKNKMPAYDKKLSEAEIKEVVAYIRTLCKK